MDERASNAARNNEDMRRHWMAVLAEADTEDLQALWDRYEDKPSYTVLHGPETGLIMVQARAGGPGDRFYLGEITVTKCFVTLDGHTTGAAFILGRRPRHAEIAAVFDALLQDPLRRNHLLDTIVNPLARRRHELERREAGRAASTRVEFMTMVRGE